MRVVFGPGLPREGFGLNLEEMIALGVALDSRLMSFGMNWCSGGEK